MALTAAERQRRRREKLKENGKYEDYKKQVRMQVQKSREKAKQKEDGMPKKEKEKLLRMRREAVKLRVAKCREKKKAVNTVSADSPNISPVFKNSAALGKATARAHRHLPSTPRRKKAVVKKLFQDLACKDSVPQKSTHRNSISAETIDLVEKFYLRDDISRQAPGRKDVVTIRNGDKKIKMPVKHLMLSIKETYEAFHKSHQDAKIKLSKFAELRPKHVLLSSKLPHNVCMCKIHENFINALNSLHGIQENVPLYSSEFPRLITCDEENKNNCWLNKCEVCKNGALFAARCGDEIDDTAVSWFIWKMNDTSNRIEKIQENGTMRELFNYVMSSIPGFLEHCYVKRNQAEAYLKMKEQMTSPTSSDNSCTALLQVDFSENYTCVSQDEIQSAHWNQNQVSLFTASLWHSEKQHAIVIASDNLTHSKETVVAYLDQILELVPPNVKTVNIWSDGPASQFKNKYIASALNPLQEHRNVLISWHFFATSHGKGPVDGIGGAVKRQVWDAVKKRRAVVSNARTFVDVATQHTSMTVILMNDADIKARNDSLSLHDIFTSALPLPGISHNHFFKNRNNVVTMCHVTEKDGDTVDLVDSAMKINVDDWVEVIYDEKHYPGLVKELRNDYYLISTMEAVGNFWRWPDRVDEILYLKDQIIQKLKAPTVVNNRGHWKF